MSAPRIQVRTRENLCPVLYDVILADPPWQFRDEARAGLRGAKFKYPVMDLQDIADLPIRGLAAPDCFLFLWVPSPMLQEGLHVMNQWGFMYKTIAFVWEKTCRKQKDLDFFGMGNYTRASTELCLLGIQGKPKRKSASVRQIIRRPVLAHSEKPPEVRKRIVELCGDTSRIELFARQRRYGWTSVGFDVGTGDIRKWFKQRSR